MRKKLLLSFIITAGCILGLIGCQGTNVNEQENTATEVVETVESQEEPVTEIETENAEEVEEEAIEESKEVKGHWVQTRAAHIYRVLEKPCIYEWDRYKWDISDTLDICLYDKYINYGEIYHWNDTYTRIEEVTIVEGSSKTKVCNEKLFYGENDTLERIEIYNLDDDSLSMIKYIDEEGNLTQIDAYDDSSIYSSIYYDTNGLIVKKECSDSQKSRDYEYKYDDEKIVEKTIKDKDQYGSYADTYTYEYDEFGNVIKYGYWGDRYIELGYVEVNGEYKLKDATDYNYDCDGDPLVTTFKYEYNNNGDITRYCIQENDYTPEEYDIELDLPDMAIEGDVLKRNVGGMLEEFVFVAD